MNAVAESWRIREYVRTVLLCERRGTRLSNLSREAKLSGANGDGKVNVVCVQLTTSEHSQAECGTGRPNLFRETKFSGANEDREKNTSWVSTSFNRVWISTGYNEFVYLGGNVV